MGLMDRDYMHERHNRASQSGKGRPSNGVLLHGDGWSRWIFWIVLVGLGFAAVSVGGRSMLAPGAEAFPPSGNVFWYVTPQTLEARFTVAAPSGTRQLYAVRLDDDVTGRPVVLIPLRGGEVQEVNVPLGRYRVTMASGTTWYGPEKLFGFFGEHKKAVDPLHFYRTGSTVIGHRLDLAKRLDGNMPTRAALPFEN
jgi:hypothetical protein